MLGGWIVTIPSSVFIVVFIRLYSLNTPRESSNIPRLVARFYACCTLCPDCLSHSPSLYPGPCMRAAKWNVSLTVISPMC